MAGEGGIEQTKLKPQRKLPRLLPPMITVAPVRCPIAAPLALPATSPAATGAGGGLFPRGTHQCQPAWIANFLGSALQDLPFGAAIPHAPRPPSDLFAPALATRAGDFPPFLLMRAPR